MCSGDVVRRSVGSGATVEPERIHGTDSVEPWRHRVSLFVVLGTSLRAAERRLDDSLPCVPGRGGCDFDRCL